MADELFQVLEYLNETGRSPFAHWFLRLNPTAAAKVTTALYRLEHGNFSNVKGVGAGVYEYEIDFGPGYRIYFGKDGERIIICSAAVTRNLKRSRSQMRMKLGSNTRKEKRRD